MFMCGVRHCPRGPGRLSQPPPSSEASTPSSRAQVQAGQVLLDLQHQWRRPPPRKLLGLCWL